jgi:uncharacterized protein YpmS
MTGNRLGLWGLSFFLLFVLKLFMFGLLLIVYVVQRRQKSSSMMCKQKEQSLTRAYHCKILELPLPYYLNLEVEDSENFCLSKPI